MPPPPGDIPASITAPRAAVDAHLASFVESLDTPTALRDAIAYALLGGGKRLRPLLAWHCGAAAAGDPDAGPATLPAGAAVELVHAFSLVHDDLPAMDDDDTRRGRPTLHVHAGEAMAVLAGDAMLALAFEAIDFEPTPQTPLGQTPTGQAGLGRPLDEPTRATLRRELSRAALGMISGQVLDTIPGARPGPTPEGVERVHDLKTGALIIASCRMGAIAAAGEAASPEVDAVTAYAAAVGRMFQVVDDLLDVEQSAEHIGKATGKDAEAGKLTYPAVHGVAGSKAIVDDLLDRSLASADKLGGSGGVLKELARFFARRTR